MKLAERNRAIKKALKAIYPSVKVVGGTGTATGWIDIDVELPRPHEHTELNNYCSTCNQASRDERTKISQIVHETTKNIGSYIGTYYADDGYNFERDEVIIQVNYI